MFVRENKKLELAISFNRIYVKELGYAVFLPISPLIGYSLENGQIFQDVFSGMKYINSDQANQMGLISCFGCATPVRDLKKDLLKHGVKRDFVRTTFNEIENHVFFYNGMEFVCMDAKKFQDENEVDLEGISVSEINKAVEELIDGRMTPEDYNRFVYGIGEKSHNQSQTKLDISIDEAFQKIKARVVSQDNAIRKILISIYKSKIFKGKQKKSNILVCGPSGVGKTEIFRSISDILNIPVHIEDMTRYTEAGYVGASVDDIIKSLYLNANKNLELAENSILVLDEIDKKASSKKSSYDFNKGDVLKSLLKIIEGGVFDIQIDKETIKFDTSDLTVVALGAFSDLYEIKNKNVIGFETSNKVNLDSSKDVTFKELNEYGMPIEFLGRFKTIVKMKTLTKDDFISIMKNSECSSLKSYIEELSNLGVSVHISDSIYERIADLAISYGAGARAINIVVDNIFENILYDVFQNMENIDRIEIGDDITENNKSYVLKKKDKNGKSIRD